MPILDKKNLLCNFKCKYCYQHPIRPEELIVDYDAVSDTIRKEYAKLYPEECKLKMNERGIGVVLHGGEPTTLPKPIFEQSLALAYELTGKSSIQTNGYLIDEDHIEMFKKYNTGVCFSIDGPWPLNELRGVGNQKTRISQTAKILKTMDDLININKPEEHWRVDSDGKKIPTKISVSIICVIHKANASRKRRDMLKEWVKNLTDKGITGRLNICVSGNPEYDLTPEEAVDFYSDMLDYMLENGIRGWSPYRDIVASLNDEDEVVCVYRECDPYCTKAAISVLRDGELGVCLKLHQDGKQYLRDDNYSNIRSRVLQEYDCKDCEWWKHCYGGCSGHAIDFDWRNKDRFCIVHKALFKKISNILKISASRKSKDKQPPKGERKDGDHSDGYEHLDGGWRHLNSNW